MKMRLAMIIFAMGLILSMFAVSARAYDAYDYSFYDHLLDWSTPEYIDDTACHTALPYNPYMSDSAVTAYLDDANTRGMEVILSCKELLLSANDTNDWTAFTNYINTFKGHPALKGWYMADEPTDNSLLSACETGYDIIKNTCGSTKPVYMVFTWQSLDPNMNALINYQYTYDVLMFDHYIVVTGEPEFSRFETPSAHPDWPGWKEYCTEAMDTAVSLDKPFVNVLQAYGRPSGSSSNMRLPTLMEERYMTFWSVLKGSAGVSFWAMDQLMNPNDPYYADAHPSDLYPYDGPTWRTDVALPICQELDQLKYALAAGPVSGAVTCNNADIMSKVYQDPSTGKYYLLTVNDVEFVLQWKMDEMSGTTASDASGRGNNGTITGATWVSGQTAGGALSFDGVNDSVSRGSVSGDFASDNMSHTVAAWIKVNALPSFRAWIMLLGNEGAGSHHWLLNSSGTTTFGCWDGVQSQPVLPVGQWRHVAVTFNGSTMNTYVNGVLTQSATGTFNLQGIPLTVAQPHNGENYFNGVVDDLRVYNWALSATEVAEAMSASVPSAITVNLTGTWSHLAGYGGSGNLPIVGNIALLGNYANYQARSFELVPGVMSTRFSDGFESGNFTAGGWVNSGSTLQTTYKYAGTYAAQLKSSNSLTKSLSTAGYKDIQVQYARYTRNCTSTCHFIAEWYNGSSWTTLEDVVGNSAWAAKTFTLPAGANNNSGFKIRFRTSGNTSTRYGHLDEVKILGQIIQ